MIFQMTAIIFMNYSFQLLSSISRNLIFGSREGGGHDLKFVSFKVELFFFFFEMAIRLCVLASEYMKHHIFELRRTI